jgi:hypothetical protein
MTDRLCYCNFWSGRATVHHRRDGCTPETGPAPDTVMAEIITSVNAAAQPLMTALADSFGRISRTLDAAWKVAQQEHHRR